MNPTKHGGGEIQYLTNRCSFKVLTPVPEMITSCAAWLIAVSVSTPGHIYILQLVLISLNEERSWKMHTLLSQNVKSDHEKFNILVYVIRKASENIYFSYLKFKRVIKEYSKPSKNILFQAEILSLSVIKSIIDLNNPGKQLILLP